MMTNREQVAWALGFGDYDTRNVAEIIADMMLASSSIAPAQEPIIKSYIIHSGELKNMPAIRIF